MAFTKYTIVATGGEGNSFPVSFTLPHLKQAEVQVRVNAEVDGGGAPLYRSITWTTDAIVLVGGAAVVNGDLVVFTNTVDITTPQHDYSKNAAITAAKLDANQAQALLVAGMILDGRFDYPFQQLLDMGTFRITSMGDPVAQQDAVTKEWAENAVTSSVASALSSATAANASEVAALAAQVAAELAETGSEAAQVAAELAQTAAETAQGLTETAKDTAVTKAAEAVVSANTATTQAGIATTQAGISTAQAVISTDQAVISTTQAGIATTQAAAAEVSEDNALASAAQAAQTLATIVAADYFEVDGSGNLMPGLSPTISNFYELDGNGDIQPQ